jgi:hypothetical protein
MAYFLGVSETAFNTWYLDLSYADVMALKKNEAPASDASLYITWNQLIDGNYIVHGIATKFAEHTMIVGSTFDAFD